MTKVSPLQSLGQVSVPQTASVFHHFLRGHVRAMICGVMAADATELCVPNYSPTPSDPYRAGSSPGRVLVDGERRRLSDLGFAAKANTVIAAKSDWTATVLPRPRTRF
jgi:hypothetical protein